MPCDAETPAPRRNTLVRLVFLAFGCDRGLLTMIAVLQEPYDKKSTWLIVACLLFGTKQVELDQAEFSQDCRNPPLMFRMRSPTPCSPIYDRSD